MSIALTPSSNNPSVDPDGTQYFTYIKNNSENNLILESIEFWVESIEYVDMYIKTDGSPVGGANVTSINMNLSSGIVADITSVQGTNLTGLSGGTFLHRFRINADNNNHNYAWGTGLIVGKNEVFSFQAGNGSIPIEMNLLFYFDKD